MAIKFEVIDHGFENSSYFQGCGVAFTKWTHVVTGAVSTPAEAYEDACEQFYTCADAPSVDEVKLPEAKDVLSDPDEDLPEDCQGEDSEVYFYVSIRWREEAGIVCKVCGTTKPRSEKRTSQP